MRVVIGFVVALCVPMAAVAALGTPAEAGRLSALAHATHRATQVTTINVTAKNSGFILSATSAPRGVVIFKVHATVHGNTIRYPHDFSIHGHTSKLIRPPQSTTLRVTFLRKGKYPWRCTFDHHASTGEKGVFTIY